MHATLVLGGGMVSTAFDVLPAGATPAAPSVGNSPVLASEPASDWLWLSAIGGGLMLLTLVLLLIGPRDDRRGR